MNIEDKWTRIAAAQLVGRTITKVRYMSQEEADDLGWYSRPVVMILSDGNVVFCSADDEGNNGGALFTNDKDQPVLPVI